MGITSWNTAVYLSRGSAVTTGPPFLVSGWANKATGGAAHNFVFTLGQTGQVSNKWRLGADTTDNLQAQTSDGVTSAQAVSSTTHPNNTWFQTAAAFLSSSSRSVWINAAGRVNDTTTLTPAAPNNTYIGVNADQSFNWASAGGLAEVSIWNITSFTSGNLDSLVTKLYNGGAGGAGGNPLNITAEASQPWTGKLLAYWPLTNTSNLADASGNGHTLTMTGTFTNFASHPTIESVGPAGPTHTMGISVFNTFP